MYFLLLAIGLNFDISFRIIRVIFKFQNSKNLKYLRLHSTNILEAEINQTQFLKEPALNN